MRNKKLFVIFAVVALFFSCEGSNGKAYLKYSWVALPTYLYDSNPSTPQTVTNGVYFHTNPGKYYMEYKAFDNSFWYMIYEITINEGKFLEDGDDLWFEITLYSTGPTLWKWTSARNIEKTELSNENNGLSILQAPGKTGLERGPILGREERNIGSGVIKIEYGKLIE
jgi:hypothetical protein